MGTVVVQEWEEDRVRLEGPAGSCRQGRTAEKNVRSWPMGPSGWFNPDGLVPMRTANPREGRTKKARIATD